LDAAPYQSWLIRTICSLKAEADFSFGGVNEQPAGSATVASSNPKDGGGSLETDCAEIAEPRTRASTSRKPPQVDTCHLSSGLCLKSSFRKMTAS
jgi:hypothetical protein